jgi:hypothetical protein
MQLIENDVKIGQFPSVPEMASLSNYELLEIANKNKQM